LVDQSFSLCFSWQKIKSKLYLIAYRLPDGALEQVLMDYVFHLSDHIDLNSVTIRNETLYLKRLIEFLPEGELGAIDDQRLREFRDYELLRTMERKNSSGELLRAKRSVNIGLRRIYHFLSWTQATGWLPEGHIGEHSSRVTVVRHRGSARRANGNHYIYPLVFKYVGEGASTSGRYFATENDKSLLEAHFRRHCTAFVYARNLLLMEIADAVGWRRGAINSLLVDQFPTRDGDVETMKVRPPSQKFGYQNWFDVGAALVTKIHFFIQNCRNPFYIEMGWNEGRSQGRIFTSARDGKPLTDQAITQIFGSAFKTIGAPRGAGIHSFRRKFADARVETEIRARLKLGLDTSTASVAASVAILLGQANPESVNSYVERSHSRMIGHGVDTSDL
jgi:hypothetical protein